MQAYSEVGHLESIEHLQSLLQTEADRRDSEENKKILLAGIISIFAISTLWSISDFLIDMETFHISDWIAYFFLSIPLFIISMFFVADYLDKTLQNEREKFLPRAVFASTLISLLIIGTIFILLHIIDFFYVDDFEQYEGKSVTMEEVKTLDLENINVFESVINDDEVIFFSLKNYSGEQLAIRKPPQERHRFRTGCLYSREKRVWV